MEKKERFSSEIVGAWAFRGNVPGRVRQKANQEPASHRSFINQHSFRWEGAQRTRWPLLGTHWSSPELHFQLKGVQYKTPPVSTSHFLFIWTVHCYCLPGETSSSSLCLLQDLQGIPCSPLQPGQTPHFVLPGEFHCPHFPHFHLFLSLNTEWASQRVPNSSKRIFLCRWRSLLEKQTCPHWVVLSRPTERLYVHWLNWSAGKEQSVGKGDYFIPFYPILFHFISVCARPNPAWMPRAKSWHWGPGRGRLRGCHEPPPRVTNVPLWLQCLETQGQTAGRKEGRKEGALEDKVVLWTAIMDI